MGYALQAFNTLAGLKPPFHAVVETHLGRIETEARMVVVANSQKYGTGVAINPNGVMNDGKFEIVILKNLDLIVFSKILSGNMPVENDDVEIISTDKAVVTTNSPVSFQIDGEYCDEVTRLEVEILPNQMRVAVP